MADEQWTTVSVNTVIVVQHVTWDQGRTTWDGGQTTWDGSRSGLLPNIWTVRTGTT